MKDKETIELLKLKNVKSKLAQNNSRSPYRIYINNDFIGHLKKTKYDIDTLKLIQNAYERGLIDGKNNLRRDVKSMLGIIDPII